MPFSARHASSRLPLRALGAVVALAIVLAAGSRADASCGDWLEGHAMDAHAAAANAGNPAQAGYPARADLGPSGTPARPTPPAPCNGPSCRRAPLLPPAPGGAPITPLDFDSDAVLPTVTAAAAASPVGFCASDEPLLCAALHDRPERPPRA